MKRFVVDCSSYSTYRPYQFQFEPTQPVQTMEKGRLVKDLTLADILSVLLEVHAFWIHLAISNAQIRMKIKIINLSVKMNMFFMASVESRSIGPKYWNGVEKALRSSINI